MGGAEIGSQSSPRAPLKHMNATCTAYWKDPAPAYLDAEETRNNYVVYFLHSHRHVVLWSVITALLAYRIACGRTLLGLVSGFAFAFGDFQVGFKAADVIFCSCLLSAVFARWRAVPRLVAWFIHLGLFILNSIIVTYLLQSNHTAVGSSLLVGMFWAMLNMKTHSFFAAHRIQNGTSQDVVWANIMPSISDTSRELPTSFLAFILQPSLVYLRYPPKLQHTRLKAALSEFAAASASVIVVHLLNTEFVAWSGQYALPQRFLFLFIPAQGIFFLPFYAFFHCGLSLMADLTRYADRTEFYGPWWLATNSGDYFRDWSMPVHLWLRRHCLQDMLFVLSPNGIRPQSSVPQKDAVSLQSSQVQESNGPTASAPPPAQKRGKERRKPTAVAYTLASTMAFVVSAFFHEQIIFMTLHVFSLPYMSIGLLLVALCMMFERWFGLEIPPAFLRMCTFLGHDVLLLLIAPPYIAATNAM